jgi:hypothetical protein
MKISTILSFFIGLFIFTSCDNKEPENQRFIRKEIHSKEALEDVKAMDKAFEIMRQNGCNDPLSWYYQGAIHYIPDSVKNNKFCDYNNFNDSKLGWRNCTHTPSKQEEIHFLVWHRIYIWHFEKIVRKLSGKKDFALPYWNYTSGDKSQMSLHPLFMDPKSSLYEACRFDSINKGNPIEGEVERALDITKLMTYTDYQLFNKNMDRAPHGTIHDYVGHGNDYNDGKLWFDNPITGTKTHDGLMGWVPTAGFDPVFWTHHANIDRIWQMWTNSNNGQMVTLEQLKSVEWPYIFFDENGKEVKYTPEEVYKILYKMDYDYDDTKVEPKSNPTLVKAKPHYLVNHSDNKTNLKGKNTIINLEKTLGQHKVFDGAFIEIEASYKDVPSGVFEVYLNTDERNTKSENFVGFMTFFGEDHKMPGKSCKSGCCKEVTVDGRTKIVFIFQHKMQEDWQFHFYNHNGYSTGDLRIDKISIKSN